MGKGLSLPVVLVLLLAACTGLLPNRPTGDLQLELKPSSLSVAQGQSQTTTLTLTPQNGFTGQVTLSLERQDGSPAPSGLSLSPTGLNVTGPNPVTQTLTLNVAGSVPPGQYALRVKATSGSLTKTANLSLTVQAPPPAPDFTLSLNPTSLTVQQGASGTTELTLTPQNGFSGTVSLTLVNAPSGLNLSPGSVNVPGPDPLTQPLLLSVSPSTPIGSYSVRIRATGNGISHEANLSLTVTQAPAGDFTLTLESPSLTVTQGGLAYVRLAVNGSYSGSISLSLVDGKGNPFPGVNLSPTSTPVPSAPMLQLAASSSLAPGTYNLFVQGTGGSLTRQAPLTLTVVSPTPPPDFTLSLNPTSLTTQQGGSGTTQLTLTPQNGFTGTVTLNVSGAPSGVQVSFQQNPWNINGTQTQTVTVSTSAATPPGNYVLTMTATGGNLSKTASLNLAVSSSSSLNLRIAKAEWGQTVLKEGLRLVAGKPALLRVHLLANPSPISLNNPLTGAVYMGSTFQGNLTFTCPNPIPTATDPGNLATTCTTTLPASWVTPGLRVELRADPQDQVAESNESDNLLTLTPNVGAGTVLHLTVVPVIHQGQQAQVPSFSQTLWRIWPLKEVSFTTRAPYTFNGNLSPSDGNAWAQLLDELRILRQTDGSGRYYYGFVKVSYTSGIAGIGYIGHPVAVGWDYAQSGPAVMAHELGHNFGREHAPCGTSGDTNYPYTGGRIGTWGYDLANGSLKDPSQFYDLMSYCSPQWISDYTYEGAQSFLESSPPKPLSLPEEGLLFSGRMGQGEVIFYPPLKAAAWPEGEASPYRLKAQAAGGQIQEAPVYVLRDSEGIVHFQARLPLGRYTRVGLYLGDRLLKEAVAPMLPQAEPQVELRKEGGFLWVRVQGYPYFSLFHVAPDGTRTTLGLWHRAGEMRFALENLPPGGQWEVQLSEGLNVRTLLFPR